MPQLKQPETLWEMCLDYVYFNFDDILKLKVMQNCDAPFTNLNWIAKSGLMQHFYDVGLCIANKHLLHIMHSAFTNLQINLHSCSINLFLLALENMKNLQNLTIAGVAHYPYDIQETFFPRLGKLQHLVIRNCYGFHDGILKSIRNSFPALFKLDVRGIQYTLRATLNLKYFCHNGNGKLLQEILISEYNKSCNLTYKDIVRLFLQHEKLVHVMHPAVLEAVHTIAHASYEQIQELLQENPMYETHPSNDCLPFSEKRFLAECSLQKSSAFKIKFLHLQKVETELELFQSAKLQTFYANVTSLKITNISRVGLSQHLLNEVFLVLINLQELLIDNYYAPCLDYCTDNLKSLMLHTWKPLTHSQIIHLLAKFSALQTLCIDEELYSSCYGFSFEEHWPLQRTENVTIGRLENLRHLKLGNCKELHKDLLKKILHLENLEVLGLCGLNSMEQLTDDLFTDTCLPNLKRLFLEDCDNVTIHAITKLLTRHNKIYVFYADYCQHLRNHEIESLIYNLEKHHNKHLDIYLYEVGALGPDLFLSNLQKFNINE